MKKSILLSLPLILGLLANAAGQGSGVQTEYLKDEKVTRVKTYLLYVYDTPDQFVEIQLWSWFKGEKLTKPASQVGLRIFSVSRNPIYLRDKDRRLVIIADGEKSSLGTPGISVRKGGNKNGVDSFSGLLLPVPKTARIKAGGNFNEMTVEYMPLSMNLDQFLKFAKTTQLEIRLGSTSLAIDESQMEVIRNFAKQITVQ